MEKDTSAFRQTQGKTRKTKQAYVPCTLTLLAYPDLTPRAKIVGLALARCVGGTEEDRKARNGTRDPDRVGIEHIALQCGSSYDFVKRGLKELEKKGLIASLGTGRRKCYFLGGVIDAFKEPKAEPKIRPSKARKEKQNCTNRESKIARSDRADLHSLQIQNKEIEINEIQNTEERVPERENSALTEPRFDDVVGDQKAFETAFETFLSLGFEAWLKEVSERASRLVGSFLNLNSSSPKLKNSLKALEAFYKEGHTPQEVAELVNNFLIEYPRKIENRAALVASSFEAILLQTPKADKALETPPLWSEEPLRDPEPPKVLTKEELEALRLEQAERAERAAQARRVAELENFGREVLIYRPSTTEEELEVLFNTIDRALWFRAKRAFSEPRIVQLLEENLTELTAQKEAN